MDGFPSILLMEEGRELANFAVGKPANGESLGVDTYWSSRITTSSKYRLLKESSEFTPRSFLHCRRDRDFTENLPYAHSSRPHFSTTPCKWDITAHLIDPNRCALHRAETNSTARSQIQEMLCLENQRNGVHNRYGGYGRNDRGDRAGAHEPRRIRWQ